VIVKWRRRAKGGRIAMGSRKVIGRRKVMSATGAGGKKPFAAKKEMKDPGYRPFVSVKEVKDHAR
jgi:hypothetical protein